MVEGGRIGLAQPNADGSADLGVMQVNTRWVMPLARHTGLSPDAVRRRLIDDPCFGIATAGAIMRIYLNEERGNLLQAIGDYHSHTLNRNTAYQLKVLSAAHVLFGQRW